MTQAMAWILVALAVVLTIAIVAVLMQLRKTLASGERTLDTLESTGRHLNETLDGVTATLTRVNRAVDELEQAANRATAVLDGLRGVSEVVGKIRSSMGLVASLGSAAVGAFLTSFGFRSRAKQEEPAATAPDEEVKVP